MPQSAAAGYAGRVPVSEAVVTALLERIRRLNRAERTVLMRASVIGQRFKFALLAATMTWPEVRVRAVLDEVCSSELIVPESRGDWFSFRHALIRDAAYEEFIATRVRPIHRRIARALERGAGSDEVSLDDLAYHSWAAADVARCIRYNELAGDQAVAAFAKDDARTYYARARAFMSLDSSGYRRLTGKLYALQSEAAQTPGLETEER